MQRLEGAIRKYDWGSTSSIPSLLGCAEDGEPWAELWLGACLLYTSDAADE